MALNKMLQRLYIVFAVILSMLLFIPATLLTIVSYPLFNYNAIVELMEWIDNLIE